jgi:hypothetical protein
MFCKILKNIILMLILLDCFLSTVVTIFPVLSFGLMLFVSFDVSVAPTVHKLFLANQF